MWQGCFTAAALAAAILLTACAATPPGDAPPALAATPVATEPAEPPKPVLRHEASAECWMKHDKSGGSLEAKTKLVGKCIDERMKAQKSQ